MLGIVEVLKPAGGRYPVACWYVASLADGDTHLAEFAPDAHLVTAHCDGRPFRPLATLHATPLDQAQTCPTCRSDQNHDDTNRQG
jgi:hypothetical protein